MLIPTLIPVYLFETMHLSPINGSKLKLIQNSYKEFTGNSNYIYPYTSIRSIKSTEVSKKRYDMDNNKIFDSLEDKIESIITCDKENTVKENNLTLRIFISINSIEIQTLNGFINNLDEICSFLKKNNCKILNIIKNPGNFGFDYISTLISNEKISIIKDLAYEFSYINYIKEEAVGISLMQDSLLQCHIYPYIREEYKLKGDKSSTIAIIDSGIDDTHTMLLGYGEQNPTKKIIGWMDFTNGYSKPYDSIGHGTFVSSVAAGYPFNRTDSVGRMISTRIINRDWTWYEFNIGNAYLDVVASFNITNGGVIMVNSSWKKPPTSNIEIYKFSIIDPKGNYAVNASITGQNINTIIEYSVDTDNLGVYKLGYVYNVSENNCNEYSIISTIHVPIKTDNSVPQLQGVAPDTKLVVLKAKSESEYIQAIEWILGNGTKYNITGVNMSFKIESSIVGQLVTQLSEHGFISVAGAGNDYWGENFAGNMENTPGCVDTVISVGAIDNMNHITSYSSQGGQTPTGITVKPDCVAPGGEFASRYKDYLQIIAADSNDLDFFGNNDTEERIFNDTKHDVGTSFACAYVSGVLQLIIEALGGHANWNYSENEVLTLKSYLLMTATETFPNERNGFGNTSLYSPTLERGEKDIHEGYGRINPKSIFDMLNKSLIPNTVYRYNLTSITAEDPYGEMCYARTVSLRNGSKYNFNLTVPNNADFDLYLYDKKPDKSGEPVISANSTKSQNNNESFRFLSEYSGVYFLVIKSVSGKGEFEIIFSENYTETIDFTQSLLFWINSILLCSFIAVSLIFIYKKLKKTSCM
ncbi:MAG: S8 family serine peptidase [Promethearchaeota archaeon]